MKMVMAQATRLRHSDSGPESLSMRCIIRSWGSHTTSASSAKSPQLARVSRQLPSRASLMGTVSAAATPAPPVRVIE